MSHPPILEPPEQPFAAGESPENPCTGERGVLVKQPWEGDDSSLEADLHVQPGGAVVGEHIHHNFDERFSVRAGRIGFRLDGSESVAVVQSALFGLLRPVARARGYRGTYPQYGRSLLRPAA